MCGRFTFQPTEAFYERFEVSNRLDSFLPRYNIAPGQMVPVIIADTPRRIVLMRWGLIPHWAKDEKSGYKMINARVETLAQRPTFRGLLSHNRALVPASGFYEWRAEGRDKIPYYIRAQDESLMAFAALYDTWTKPDGEVLCTVTIITTEANDFMAKLHNRMPVMLATALQDTWLDPALTQAQDVLDVLSRSTSLRLEAYPVSRQVNRPSVDSEALIQRVE
jgi:putative SOS response-associated peptidase YedK